MAVVEHFKKKIAGTDLVGNFLAELEAWFGNITRRPSRRHPEPSLGLGHVCGALHDQLPCADRRPAPFTFMSCFGFCSYILGRLLRPTCFASMVTLWTPSKLVAVPIAASGVQTGRSRTQARPQARGPAEADKEGPIHVKESSA